MENTEEEMGSWNRPIISLVTLKDMQSEAARAHRIHGRCSMAGPELSVGNRLAILMEEVGEVAKEINEAEIAQRPVDSQRITKELIQVGAMAGTWAEQEKRAQADRKKHA